MQKTKKKEKKKQKKEEKKKKKKKHKNTHTRKQTKQSKQTNKNKQTNKKPASFRHNLPFSSTRRTYCGIETNYPPVYEISNLIALLFGGVSLPL